MSTRARALTFVLVAACLLCSAWLSPRLAGSAADPATIYRAPAIAVVDIEDVTNDYLRHTGDIERRKNQYITERRALDVLRETIESMDQESEVYAKDSAEYLQLRTQIAIKTQEFKVRSESNDVSHDRDRAKLMKEAYDKAVQVIHDFALARQLDLVLLKQGSEIKGATMAEVGSNILVRTVLFHRDDGQVDVTEQIKELIKK